MPTITNSVEIKRAITLLQLEQSEKAKSLRDNFNQALEEVSSSKILNIALANSITGIATKNLIKATTGIAVGYLIRKSFNNTSGSIFKKILMTVIQVGLTRAVAQHTNEIKSIGQSIFQLIFQSKKT